MSVIFTGMRKRALRRRPQLLIVSDSRCDFRLQLWGDLSNSLLLCVFGGILQHFLFSLTTNHMVASRRWINFGAFNLCLQLYMYTYD